MFTPSTESGLHNDSRISNLCTASKCLLLFSIIQIYNHPGNCIADFYDLNISFYISLQVEWNDDLLGSILRPEEALSVCIFNNFFVVLFFGILGKVMLTTFRLIHKCWND